MKKGKKNQKRNKKKMRKTLRHGWINGQKTKRSCYVILGPCFCANLKSPIWGSASNMFTHPKIIKMFKLRN